MGTIEDLIYKSISKDEKRFLKRALSIAKKAGEKILELTVSPINGQSLKVIKVTTSLPQMAR